VRALRPGDRLPDVALTERGRPVHAHDLLDLSRWTLLATDGDEASAEHVQRLQHLTARYRSSIAVRAVHAEGAAAKALDGDGRAVLVRPDGHVGAVARLHDATALAGYLDAHLTRA
jgi:hypothetical protein